ncbi:DUF3631 domain-containing protein [Candidatus Kaiserbacteria bacterium]|nr:DUF3631 domain-containing protein [Candidatus Kaiserbacteria bacterium]
MESFDKEKLSDMLFSSQARSPQVSELNAAEDKAVVIGGEGHSNTDSSLSKSFRDNAERIIAASESGSVVDPALENPASNLDNGAGATKSVSLDLASDAICESDEESIARLAALSPFDYDRTRLEEAKRLGVQVGTLDAEVKASRGGESKTASDTPFKDIEPYAGTVDPAELFSSISFGLRCFLIISEAQADAMTLWAAHTHLVDLFEVSPLLLFNAPERACAKTLAQTLIGKLCYRPLPAANATLSALFRSVEWKPTILVDEADTFLGSNQEVLGLINAGYKAGGFILRSESTGESYTPKMFSVFCPKSLAGIALERHLPDSTLSRCIPINMRRKLPGESVQRLRYADKGLFDSQKSQLARFALDYAKQIRQARPVLPEELGDRSQDSWEPLLAIASCAGQAWLERATKAAIELSGNADDAGSVSNELLADIREVFAKERVGKLCSADLISALTTNGDMGWGSYNRGNPLTARQLAKRLSTYGIKPKNLRFKSATLKGYEKSDFVEAFERYLPSPGNPPQRCDSPNALSAKDSTAADDGGAIRHAASAAQQDDDLTAADRAVAAFHAEHSAAPRSSPEVERGGDADAAGKGGEDDDVF